MILANHLSFTINKTERQRIMYKNKEINYNDEDIKNHNSVGAIVFNNAGEVLVVDHIKYNFFTLPIGKARLDEDLKGAMARELFEECNIKVLSLKEVKRIRKEEERRGRLVKMGIVLFKVSDWEGEIFNNEFHKHKSVMFMSIDQLRMVTNNGQNTSWITEMFLNDRELSSGEQSYRILIKK